MNTPQQQIQTLLSEMEHEMKRLDLRSKKRPTDQALASEQPFCYDTLVFGDWLQWVFVPRIQLVLARDLSLSAKSDIAPLAEVWLKERGLEEESLRLVDIIRTLDRQLSIYVGFSVDGAVQ